MARQLVERIGVVGGGVTGQATARSWLEHAGEVRVHDIVDERRTHTLAEVLNCDWVFVHLPTPHCDVNGISLEHVFKFFMNPEMPRDGRYVLRSTVLPGTTDRLHDELGYLRITYSPEFLTARCAFTDAQVPTQVVVGHVGSLHEPPEFTTISEAISLSELLAKRFPGSRRVLVPAKVAELAKLSLNTFFAAKVSVFNQIHDLCQACGVPFESVRNIMLGDGRIAHAHHQVPGPSGECGYGGVCLPKDSLAFLRLLEQANLPAQMVRGFVEYNEAIRNG